SGCGWGWSTPTTCGPTSSRRSRRGNPPTAAGPGSGRSGSGRAWSGRAGDGAAPLDQDHVAPAAVQVADPFADAHHAEALPLVQAEAGGGLPEDAGLGGPG